MTLQTVAYFDTQLIFRTEDGLLHVPDAQAATLWQALRSGVSIQAICQAIAAPAEQAACIAQLTTLQQQWQQLRLLDDTTPALAEYQQILRPARTAFSISTNDPAIHSHLQQAYAACQTNAAAEEIGHYLSAEYDTEQQTYQILLDGKPRYSKLPFAQTLINLSYLIGELATHEEPRLLVLHAAAVHWQGKVWLLPAKACSGKSTLTASLLAHGAQLLNDDIVPLNPDGTASAIQQPLKIKSGAWAVLAPLYPQLADMPALVRPDGLVMKQFGLPPAAYCPAGAKQRVDCIVVPEYNPTIAKPALSRLDEAQTLQAVLAAEPYFPHRLTRPYLQNILEWLQPLRGFHIAYRNTAEALALLQAVENQLG